MCVFLCRGLQERCILLGIELTKVLEHGPKGQVQVLLKSGKMALIGYCNAFGSVSPKDHGEVFWGEKRHKVSTFDCKKEYPDSIRHFSFGLREWTSE